MKTFWEIFKIVFLIVYIMALLCPLPLIWIYGSTTADGIGSLIGCTIFISFLALLFSPFAILVFYDK